MATVESAIRLSDGMTGPFNGIVKSLNLVINAMSQMQGVMDQNEKISKTVDAAKSAIVSSEAEMVRAIEETIRAQEKLNEQFNKQPPLPREPEPPAAPTWEAWKSPEVFQSRGVERYTQEIDALQTKIQALSNSQQALDMSNTKFLPPQAISDISTMQQRLQNLGTLLKKVEMQKELLGNADPEAFDALSGSAEKIRGAIQAAVNQQEALNKAMKDADLSSVQRAYTNLNSIIDNTEVDIRNNTREQEKFNQAVESGGLAADGLWKKIIGFVGAYAGYRAVKGFFSASTAAANEQIAVEQRLQTIMGNINGMTQDGIELVKQRARELEKTPVAISATVGIAGQSQLAQYVYDPKNIVGMTEAMYNLATETYGANVSQDQLMQTANLMGKVMMGDINALSRNGFKIDAIFTEAEQKLLKTGTEAERAAMVIEMIDENLAGLAEAMGNTPEGQAIRLANAWGAVQEKIGYGLIPLISQFTSQIIANMPTIERVVFRVFGTLINLLTGIFNIAMTVSTFIIDNWSFIAPIVTGLAIAITLVTAAITALNTVTAVKNTLMAISAARTAIASGLSITAAAATNTATGAQVGLNAAMLASPITWIILGIVALIGLVYLIVAAINKWAGTTLSATGMIAGAISVVGAVIANIFLGLLQLVFGIIEYWYNWFIAFANFFANLFNDPIGAVIKLFSDMADNVLNVLQRIASAMDFVFGSNMADTVKGWRADLSAMAELAVKEYGNGTYEDKFDKLDIDSILDDFGMSLDRLSYGDAYQAGYDWGDNLNFGLGDNAFTMPDLPVGGNLPTGAWDVGDGTLPNIDKVKKVGKIEDKVDISSEDLKTMRELAEMKNIQNFVTVQPQLSFGDTHIRQESDLNTLIARITDQLGEEINSSVNSALV